MDTQRMLVVSDDDVLRCEIVDTLQDGGGYRVNAASNFEDALDAILKERYALVITEVKLPKVSGIDLLLAIQTLSPYTSVIVIDEELVPRSAIAAFRLGAADYLHKPLNMDFVLIRVHQEIESRAQQVDDIADIQPPPVKDQHNREQRLNPNLRAAMFMLRRPQYLKLQDILSELRNRLNARFIALTDAAHNLVAAVGELAGTDLRALREVLAQERGADALSNLLGESEFSHSFFEGEHSVVFITDFGDQRPVSLIVICGGDAKPGMVWLWSKRTAAEVESILADACQTMTMPVVDPPV